MTVFVEPLAGGLQYVAQATPALGIGVAVSAGPLYGVSIAAEQDDDVRNLAAAFATLTVGTGSAWRVIVNPIGAAVVHGNDFTAVYPSAQLGLELLGARLRFGSLLRVIRIAGANDTGEYWTQWVPLRVGYALGRRD